MTSSTTRVLAELRRRGLLLKQDKSLPSVVGIVTGESLATSWWSHPRAKEIFDLLEHLAERADVIETKLLAGKVTFVDEAFWSALLGVALSGESWQRAGLSAKAKQLLEAVNRDGARAASGAPAKELELRLAARSEQRHTESGKHVLVLESWSSWAERRNVRALGVDESKAMLERAALALGAPLGALPWRAEGKFAKKAGPRRRRL
ncbi:MAG TPA: hypothetical protein VHV51_19700 [Polyangiaceae bacterium]|jgi:hypothetical protein|nr:hypothetical protein [Polyangiaceae bacterium]